MKIESYRYGGNGVVVVIVDYYCHSISHLICLCKELETTTRVHNKQGQRITRTPQKKIFLKPKKKDKPKFFSRFFFSFGNYKFNH